MEQEQNKYKSGFVTLIGRPNVGKSTLMNHLIGQKIAITSNKPQTTRNRIQTVYTDERGQIVFLDTPGIHKAKNKLGEYMVNAARETLKEVDVILWLVEPTTYIGAGEQQILRLLKQIKTPVILVINKVDTIPKEDILKYIDRYRGEYDFAEIVSVSALKKLNTDGYKKMMFRAASVYPNFKVIATTLREVRTATVNDWSALCYADGKVVKAKKYKKLEIMDRVGGGDSFASGLIYGLMTTQDAGLAVNYGAAHGALAMTTPGDTTMVSKKEVEAVMQNAGARVQR